MSSWSEPATGSPTSAGSRTALFHRQTSLSRVSRGLSDISNLDFGAAMQPVAGVSGQAVRFSRTKVSWTKPAWSRNRPVAVLPSTSRMNEPSDVRETAITG
jgi:hypothetical protein